MTAIQFRMDIKATVPMWIKQIGLKQAVLGTRAIPPHPPMTRKSYQQSHGRSERKLRPVSKAIPGGRSLSTELTGWEEPNEGEGLTPLQKTQRQAQWQPGPPTICRYFEIHSIPTIPAKALYLQAATSLLDIAPSSTSHVIQGWFTQDGVHDGQTQPSKGPGQG